MKKWMILSAALWLVASMGYAKKSMVVTDGDICSLLGQDTTVSVAFDYSHTRWEQEESYKDFCGDDYQVRVDNSLTTFTEAFNRTSKTLRATNSGEAAYRMVVVVDNLERKQGMVMWGRMYIRVTGQIRVFDAATNEPVLTVTVQNLAGDEDFVPNDRLNKCFDKLATQLVALGKKCK